MASLQIVATEVPEPPYPAETRAGNYMFSMDMGRVLQSSTWRVAPAELKPWLLMLWVESWQQIPMCSLPDDDEVIAAIIGMPATTFAVHRNILLRGWSRHSDGRMYHNYLTTRVQAMLKEREQYRERQKKTRLQRIDLPNVTRDSREYSRLSHADVEFDVDVDRSSSRAMAVADAPAAPPKKRDKQQKATRLPEGWFLPDDWKDWAVTVYKLDPQRVVRISLDFRDYWWAKAGSQACKRDWLATWRRWVRKECGDA